MKLKYFLVGITAVLCLTSCGSSKLVTTSVAYQSVRPVNYKVEVPDDAKIHVSYSIDKNGILTVGITNETDEVMVIDRTKSFFIEHDLSHSFYDPHVTVTSNTTTTSETTDASVNLGAVAGVLGIGGPIGHLANGVNVGGSSTDGYSTTNTTYAADQPQISIGPKSFDVISSRFHIDGVGISELKHLAGSSTPFSNFFGVTSKDSQKNITATPSDSYCKFSVCVSYSTDGGKTFDKIITDFYANSLIVCPVKSHGKVNDALRTLLLSKTDALNETWWLLYFNSNIDSYYNWMSDEHNLIDFK